MSTKKATGGRADITAPNKPTDYEALSTWAETAEVSPNARITKASGQEAGMALLEAAMGSPAAVRRAVGKPSLSDKGSSPSRSVRLPADMDAQLVALAQHVHMKPSEVIRRALGEYLAKAS
jgi:hypothetical protein